MQKLWNGTILIPDQVPFGITTVLEPWGCVVGGLKVSGIQPGDTVVVVGGGFMGQGFVHIAPLFGAGKVVAIDFSDYRLGKALELGATHTINPKVENSVEKMMEINTGRLVDVVILTAPSIKALESAYELLGPGATLHINAPPPNEEIWSFSPGDMYFKEISITTKYSADHFDTHQVLCWLAAGRIDPKKAITHRFPLEEITTAFDLLLKADKSLKSVIYPNGMDYLIYLYQHRVDIKGVCHTHSPFCSSFALLGQPIPAATTPIAHLLGQNVPCTEYARAGYVDTGEAIIKVLGNGLAVLVKNHGVFIVGKSPTYAAKVAAYLEEAAETIHYAMLRGQVEALPDDEWAAYAVGPDLTPVAGQPPSGQCPLSGRSVVREPPNGVGPPLATQKGGLRDFPGKLKCPVISLVGGDL